MRGNNEKNHNIVGFTGKEYEVTVSIALKSKPLEEMAAYKRTRNAK